MVVSSKLQKCFIDGCNKVARNVGGPCEMHYYRKRRTGTYNLIPVSTSKKIEFEVSSDGCFEVTSHARQTNGYFAIRHFGVRKSMHRFIYEQCFGEIPKGLYVLHKCDNKKCINPEHLEVGTPKKNARDAVERLGVHLGSKHPAAKLSESKVKRIKYLLKTKKKRNVDLAKEFNVDPTTISDIKRGKTWSHVEVEHHE